MRFKAPWGREVWIITLLGLFVMGLPLTSGILRARPIVPVVIVTVVLAIIVVLCVRGYEIVGGELRIRRLFWNTIWPLDAGARATVRPNAMQGSWRRWGNGGMFAICGHFSGSGLGRYRAFVTDPGRTVVIETRAGIVVVSPDRPQEFARALERARPAS
jgi:hypothetical protein